MDRYSHDMLSSGTEHSTQRRGARDNLLFDAQFRVVDREPVQVRVRNLSAGGLMAEHAEPLARGTVVEVEVRGVGWVSGHIAWCAEGRVGVAFDREIDPQLARKPAGTGA